MHTHEHDKGKPAAPARSARAIAAGKLAEQARRWPDFGLAPMVTEGLSPRDAALAHAIYDEGMRRWITLEWLLDQFLEKPLRMLEPALQGVLISGAVQLVLMDRVPDHAATDESVELAKAMVRPGAAAITNAVLRRIAETAGERTDETTEPVPRDRLPLSDGGWVRLNGRELPEPPLPRLGVSTSHPSWLLKRWSGKMSRDDMTALGMHGLIHAPTVLNTAHAKGALPDGLVKHAQRGCHLFTGSHAELSAMLSSRDDLWVQDPASCRAVAGARERIDRDPAIIVDACAGQGTKTRHLLHAFPKSRIVATDTDDRRLATLSAEFAGNERVEVLPPRELLFKVHGLAELVLLDVPCTNTGVLSRRVEARYRCDDEQLKRLTDIQKQIIADTIPLLRMRPRGLVLYSTCSLEPEENQQQVDWASRWHALRVNHHESTRPQGRPGGDPREYSDGAFWALVG